jgi:hypothetical protein
MAGKLSTPSPGFDRGKDRWSAPEPTAGKLSVLSAGPPPPVLAPLGLLGWPAAVGAPLACVALASAGGTARKESVISQGGTPVFGRVLPASDLPASDLPASDLPASCFADLGFADLGFAAPGLAVEGGAPLVPG